MREKSEFVILVVVTFLIACVVWFFEGKIYAGILYLIPPVVIGLASKYPDVPIFKLLTVKLLPTEDSSTSKDEYLKLQCLAFVKLSLFGFAVFCMLIPFVKEGYIGTDFENPKNPFTILIMILPLLLLISVFGAIWNLSRIMVSRWLARRKNM